MSIFASQTAITLPFDLDPPQTITVRKLTGREIERAQVEHLRQFVAGQSPRAWAGTLRRLLATGTRLDIDEKAIADGLADPLLGYDRYTVVQAGLVTWSYNGGGKPSADMIDDLDDDAVDAIARAILRLSKPSLFLTPDERDAAKKNA